MLTDLLDRIKAFLRENQRDLYLAVLVFLMSVASFGLGRLSAIWPEKEPIRIENLESSMQNLENSSIAQPTQLLNSRFQILDSTQGSFVASKNGSSYHRPDCPGAKQIKDENKLWFKSREAAAAAGYKPAGNCPGL